MTAPEKRLLVIGAGGHARVLIEALRSSGAGARIEGCLDEKPALHGRELDGAPVLGGDALLERYPPERFALVNALGAVSDTRKRRAVFDSCRAKGYVFLPVVAASAVIAATARLDDGSQALTRAVVHPGASVGANAVINTAAVIEHDSSVGPHAFVGPAAVLCGGVSVGEGAFIGAGALLLPGVRVGDGALVSAGAVVRKDVPAGAQLLAVAARQAMRRPS